MDSISFFNSSSFDSYTESFVDSTFEALRVDLETSLDPSLLIKEAPVDSKDSIKLDQHHIDDVIPPSKPLLASRGSQTEGTINMRPNTLEDDEDDDRRIRVEI